MTPIDPQARLLLERWAATPGGPVDQLTPPLCGGRISRYASRRRRRLACTPSTTPRCRARAVR
jgi:hypothetical protein